MAKWIEDVVEALEKLSGIAPLSAIYKEVRKLRPKPHPKSLEAIIRREIETHSSDSESFNGTKDLFYSEDGLGKGIWGLRGKSFSTPRAADTNLPKGNHEPDRKKEETYRILRDTVLAKKIKGVNGHKCQLCDKTIILPSGLRYAEAHHIKPLGKPYNGPDVQENIIVLCPNHHVMLDYGVIKLSLSRISRKHGHGPSKEYVDYHNDEIFGKVGN